MLVYPFRVVGIAAPARAKSSSHLRYRRVIFGRNDVVRSRRRLSDAAIPSLYESAPIACKNVNRRWIASASEPDRSFRRLSFVQAIAREPGSPSTSATADFVTRACANDRRRAPNGARPGAHQD